MRDDDILDALLDDPYPVDGDGPEQWLAHELADAGDRRQLEATAETWLRRLKSARRRIARIEAIADDEIQRIIRRRDDLTAGDRRAAESIVAGLTEIHRRLIGLDPVRPGKPPASASVKLIAGTLRSKLNHTATKLKITDRDEFTEWARKAAPGTVTDTPTVTTTVDEKAALAVVAIREDRDPSGNVTAAKALDPETGELVPGITPAIPERSFWIEDMGAEHL